MEKKLEIGEIVAKLPVDEIDSRRRHANSIRRMGFYGPLSVEQLMNGLKKAEESKAWSEKKAEEKERKALAREAKKAIAEELRVVRTLLRMEEKKEKDAAEKAEKAQNKKLVALGITPAEAVARFNELDAMDAALSGLEAEYDKVNTQRNELICKAREAKSKMGKIAEGLKKPMSSSKYRAALAEKNELEAQVLVATEKRKAIIAKGRAASNERKALWFELRAMRKHSNAAVRPTIRAIDKMLEKIGKRSALDKALRKLETVAERMKKNSFQIWSWDKDTVLESSGLKNLFAQINGYKSWMKNGKVTEEKFAAAKAAVEQIEEMIKREKPIQLHVSTARPSRLRENLLSICMRIDTEDKNVRDEWISVEHGIYTNLQPNWKLFSANKKEGTKLAHNFVDEVFTLLDNIEITWRDWSTTIYNGLYSSASHQKNEKLVSCKKELMEVHEELVWFGKTKAEVLASDVTGAEIWKMRANLARPIAFAVKTKDGRTVYLHNILVVPDVKKNYKHKNAILIGGDHNGKPYQYGEAENPTILGDGAIIAVVELEHNSEQGGGAGLKGMIVYEGGSLAKAEELSGKKANIPDDKYLVCGDGCFKFDKLYANYDEFAERMNELANRYPGINQVYALREAEELEDEEKIRRLSRSLLQQLPVASDEEMHQLADNAINSLLYKKTFEGLFTSMAELGVPEENRSAFAKVIFECPGLLTNPIVQAIAKKSWECKQRDAIGNYLRTKGQYPYIMQDPVALLQVWLLGADPDDPNLGLLKDGEASLIGVPDGKEMVVIRYPANFFTAKTVICKVHKDVYGGCGNVAILSIHDDVLIVQDGDVDGDEAGFFYDKLLVKLVKRMRKLINPPVVVFEHGGKAERTVIGNDKELKRRMYASLHSAKEFDSVGKYANLARDCAYLLSIALRKGTKAQKAGEVAEATEWNEKYNTYMLWMAAASTGAILAIDQVKGNKIDPKLISWLEVIEKEVKKTLVKKVEEEQQDGTIKEVDKYFQPFTQPYVKGDMSIETLDANMDVCTDELGWYVKQETGKWDFDKQGFVENAKALADAILDNRHKMSSVKSNPLTTGVLATLRANYFNRKGSEGYDGDAKIFQLIKEKKPVSQADVLKMYWRNACTLEFRMQSATVKGKKAEYHKMVRDSILAQALNYQWVAGPNGAYPEGHVFTDEEKTAICINTALCYALEIKGRTNDIDKESKPSFAKFVISVFAEDIIANVRRNSVDMRAFMCEGVDVNDDACGYEETAFEEVLEENNECAEQTYEEETYVSDDDDMWFSTDEEEPPYSFFEELGYSVAC